MNNIRFNAELDSLQVWSTNLYILATVNLKLRTKVLFYNINLNLTLTKIYEVFITVLVRFVVNGDSILYYFHPKIYSSTWGVIL